MLCVCGTLGAGSKDSSTVPGLRMSCLSCVLWRSWRRAEGILRLCSRWCSTDWCYARVCSTLIRRGGGAWQGECTAVAAALLCPACNALQCNATAAVTVWEVEFSQTRRPAGNLMCWTSRTTLRGAWRPVKPLNRASVSSSSFGGRLGVVMRALTPTLLCDAGRRWACWRGTSISSHRWSCPRSCLLSSTVRHGRRPPAEIQTSHLLRPTSPLSAWEWSSKKKRVIVQLPILRFSV